MASRSLDELLPEVRGKVEAFLAAALKQGLDLKVITTFRSDAEQNELYAQGRTKPGRIVTNAVGGKSWHAVRRAADLVPLDENGNIRWDWPKEVWKQFGALAESAGLEWGGRWKMADLDHVQLTNGLTLEEAHKALAGQPWPPPLQQSSSDKPQIDSASPLIDKT